MQSGGIAYQWIKISLAEEEQCEQDTRTELLQYSARSFGTTSADSVTKHSGQHCSGSALKATAESSLTLHGFAGATLLAIRSVHCRHISLRATFAGHLVDTAKTRREICGRR
ncbi:unnamed protein product [Gongylonema pulchrum]|uniref:Uncharacterized protein n=1 Tax=Gongylonema pulchrum TaxID=637853 RepID=A0A183DMS9_9BILA|nr:unnamed protein product [Gongylonema pulchrum]